MLGCDRSEMQPDIKIVRWPYNRALVLFGSLRSIFSIKIPIQGLKEDALSWNTFCSMLLFYRPAVHKFFYHVGNWDTEICIWNSWQGAPAFLFMLLFFILETTILLFHVIVLLCYFWSWRKSWRWYFCKGQFQLVFFLTTPPCQLFLSGLQ